MRTRCTWAAVLLCIFLVYVACYQLFIWHTLFAVRNWQYKWAKRTAIQRNNAHAYTYTRCHSHNSISMANTNGRTRYVRERERKASRSGARERERESTKHPKNCWLLHRIRYKLPHIMSSLETMADLFFGDAKRIASLTRRSSCVDTNVPGLMPVFNINKLNAHNQRFHSFMHARNATHRLFYSLSFSL